MRDPDSSLSRLSGESASSMTNGELISYVLSVAVSKGHADKLLLSLSGSLRKASTLSVAEIRTRSGMTKRAAARLVASLELAKRFSGEQRETGIKIRTPRDVVAFYSPRIEDLSVEEFHVCILDAQHQVERDVVITRGILNSSLVHPREVFREAIAEGAAAIVLVHNHPSGDPSPSSDDRAVTEQLVAAGRLLDIPVHDHVIIGRGRYVSFVEAGMLEPCNL